MNTINNDTAITILDWIGKVLIAFIIIWLFFIVVDQQNNTDKILKAHEQIISNQLTVIDNQLKILERLDNKN